MGTKGYYAIVFQGRIYVFVSRADAYPRGLGKVLLDEIRSCNMDEWKEMIKNGVVIQNEEDHNLFFFNTQNRITTSYHLYFS